MSNDAVMFIPYLTCDAANSGLDSSFPVLTISSTGYTGLVGSLSVNLIESEPYYITCTGESSYWSFGDDLDLPLLTAEGYCGGMSLFDIDSLTATGTGHSNEVASLSQSIKVLTLEASGKVSNSGSLNTSLPSISLSATGVTNVRGTSSITLPAVQMSTSIGYTIPVGTSVTGMTLPMLELNKSGIVAGRFAYPVTD